MLLTICAILNEQIPKKGCASGQNRKGRESKSDISGDMLVSHGARMIAGTITKHMFPHP